MACLASRQSSPCILQVILRSPQYVESNLLAIPLLWPQEGGIANRFHSTAFHSPFLKKGLIFAGWLAQNQRPYTHGHLVTKAWPGSLKAESGYFIFPLCGAQNENAFRENQVEAHLFPPSSI